MCLFVSQNKTDKLKASKREVIDVYKVYFINKEKKYLSPICQHKPIIKKFGIVKSDRESTEISKYEKTGYISSDTDTIARVDKGIHVCLTKSASKEWCEPSCNVILTCKAKKEHLVAAGDEGEAVFTQIEIPETEWNRVFDIKKKSTKRTAAKKKTTKKKAK